MSMVKMKESTRTCSSDEQSKVLLIEQHDVGNSRSSDGEDLERGKERRVRDAIYFESRDIQKQAEGVLHRNSRDMRDQSR